MNNQKNKLGHPLFILCLAALLLNDWVLKSAYHNDITGKLSDFAGLFAFPFFFSSLFPKQAKAIHIATAVFFIYWKSAFSQPLIDIFNTINIPIHRTVDLTDLIALLSIGLSFIVFQKQFNIKLKPVMFHTLFFISCFAFIATSQKPNESADLVIIDKEYPFNFSKQELISRFNKAQLEQLNIMKNQGAIIVFNSKTNVFNTQALNDTIALILDYNKLSQLDTINFKTSYTEIQFYGNDSLSTLKLLSTYLYLPQYYTNDYRKEIMTEFEKRIVTEIQNHH
ncbi:hypothetical protein [Flavobacterium sp. '19STA2R22 D10 B1']|uniref:hypothetical protein n=1 Tax=Flavobacterium aerium TaxID=3037261 RepID=UPI00278C5159|nr:hypothetical protein [Flavobacterium sp. '19STA2R22 D10 B1']